MQNVLFCVYFLVLSTASVRFFPGVAVLVWPYSQGSEHPNSSAWP